MSQTEASPAPTSKAFGLGMVAVVLMLILPVPPLLLDTLLTLSVSISLLIFLLAISFGDPVEFSTFPAVLLVTTTFRLSLNIASTRLILLHGSEGADAAGQVIFAFGEFVVGGSYVVGIIVFLILVVINFKVITAGAGRIAEVAARFTLDALPGKQMAIDSDLSNGYITEPEARRRREELSNQADFYGAMDGANKFVKGDAVAGLIITAINVVGGIVIGMVQKDMAFAAAAETYIILTIGDGLVSQIPALLVSTSAGFIATRTSGGDDLGSTLKTQLLGRREPLTMASIALLVIGSFPGMPFFTFAALAGGTFLLARRASGVAAADAAEATEDTAGAAQAEPTLHELMSVDLLALEVGFDLVPLVDGKRGGELLGRISQIRKQIAQDLGVVVPPVRVRDNLQLAQNSYRLLVSGTSAGGGELEIHRLMAIDPGGAVGNLRGRPAKEPAFGMPAVWITAADRERAEVMGYTVVDPPTVAATHLTEMFRAHAADFLGRAEAQDLIDAFAETNPKLVEEVIPTLLPLGEVIKVLKNLLREGVSIRDLRSILEAIADHAATVKETEPLTELVRQRMARALTDRFSDPQGQVHALVLDPSVEAVFRGDGTPAANVDPAALPRVVRGLEQALGALASVPSDPLLLTSPDIRATVATVTARHAPGLAVMSFREVDARATVKTAGVVRLAA
ncbi:MAG: flagellar biosynthesis protein FlhA [Myxococcales bacterium FL481]|nr:MAG: flagellar biosynthesis protein FlhA [Myxococcales bacterium FL481]